MKNNNNEPVAGAAVMNVSLHIGTVTDAKGFFKIMARVGDVVRISYVGFKGTDIIITKELLEQRPDGTGIEPVSAILSNDYTSFIHSKQHNKTAGEIDSFNNINFSTLRLNSSAAIYGPIASLSIRNNRLDVKAAYSKKLSVGGTYTASLELQSANQTPALQNTYAQGRPLNGQLTWQGAETGEAFSFGPAMAALHYDGSSYAYDVNGRLVNGGNGKAATAYDNNVLQTAFAVSQALSFHGSYYHKNGYLPKLYFSVDAGQTGQSTIIRYNRNSGNNIGAILVANPGSYTITASYRYQRNAFSNSNRNGFLNRVYQTALLTPASFSNKQGYLLPNGQRSYSNMADNPYFLLQDNDNSYSRNQHNAGLAVERKKGKFTFRLAQSLDAVAQSSNEAYKRGTVAFEGGKATERLQYDHHYLLQGSAIHNTYKNRWSSNTTARYSFSANTTTIQYSQPQLHYQYQRSANDIALIRSESYNGYWFDAGAAIANKLYFSNTASHASYLLPDVSSYFQFKDVFSAVNVKLVAAWHSFNNELPIHQSLAYANLLQLNTEQYAQYFPTTEVSTYKGIAPVKHREWSGRVEIDYSSKIALSAEVFIRKTKGDVFPVNENGKLNLRNLADHQSKGIELNLSLNGRQYYYTTLKWSNSWSFLAYSNRVTHVADSYNNLPIAGFSDVHKALIENQPLGAIVGKAWLRDKSGNKIIGANGFPLVDNQPQVVGNAIPDFLMKMSNTLSWRAWKLQLDWEWRKGGSVWNGTQAVLDYYGRSANSAQLRNTTQYVFSGVAQNGGKNLVPVSFADPSQPLQTNRWTRYGYSGVAEDYMQRGDHIRIHTATIFYSHMYRKIVQKLTIAAYMGNLVLWSAYKGVDPNQLLYDQPNTEGLDFFDLPSAKSFGINAIVQF